MSMTSLAQLGHGDQGRTAGRHSSSVGIAGLSPRQTKDVPTASDGDRALRSGRPHGVEAASLPLVTGVARRWIVRLLALSCLVLLPWTVGLAVTLPRAYLVGNWPLAWTGFDVALLGCLSTTAWALWRQRLVAVPAAMASCVLMVCDAWFDIVTAHGGRCLIISISTAGAAELPLAILLGWAATRLLRANLRAARSTERVAGPPSLWRTPLLVADARALPTPIAGPIGEDPRFAGPKLRHAAPACRAKQSPPELRTVTVSWPCSRTTSHRTERNPRDEHQKPHT
jgi:hypothetical protein